MSGRVVNLSQLDDSNCLVSRSVKAQKHSLFFTLFGIEVFEEAARLFYANLRFSSYSRELETLVLGNRLIISEPLFADVFGTNFFRVIPNINGSWPTNFEVTLEEANAASAEPESKPS